MIITRRQALTSIAGGIALPAIACAAVPLPPIMRRCDGWTTEVIQRFDVGTDDLPVFIDMSLDWLIAPPLIHVRVQVRCDQGLPPGWGLITMLDGSKQYSNLPAVGPGVNHNFADNRPWPPKDGFMFWQGEFGPYNVASGPGVIARASARKYFTGDRP